MTHESITNPFSNPVLHTDVLIQAMNYSYAWNHEDEHILILHTIITIFL